METLATYNSAPVATTPQRTSTMLDVESNRSVAEVQAMVVMAKKFPRNTIEATDHILNECQRQGLAEVALYTYSRGGTEITGPSIRLAEVLARHWGNLDAGVKELSRTSGQSEVMAFCTDFETNYRQSKTFTVVHERSTKRGTYALEDARDIYEHIANQGARRLRATILAVIPGDIIEAAVSQCESTLKAKADTSAEALKKLVVAFDALKVTKEQIEKRIQRRLDTITPAQLIQLRKIYNSLKDGMSAPADWFEIVPSPSEDKQADGTEALKNKLRGKNKGKAKDEIGQKADEYAPGECPYSPGTIYKQAHCDDCAKRQGCPVWG